MHKKQGGFLSVALAIILAVVAAGTVGYFALGRPDFLAQEQTPISVPDQVATTTSPPAQTMPPKQAVTPTSSKVMPLPPPKPTVVPPPPIQIPTEPAKGIITILEPKQGTIVHPGDTIPIRFVPPSGIVFESVMVGVDGGLHLIEQAPFETTYQVPARAIGLLEIGVWAFDTKGGRLEGSSYITVDPTAKIESIEFDSQPLIVFFFKDGNNPLCGSNFRVLGNYDDGVQRDITMYGTSYRTNSGNSDVIAIISGGCVQAKGTGEDYIIVENSGKSAALHVLAGPPDSF